LSGSSQLSKIRSETLKTAMVNVMGSITKSPVKKSELIESTSDIKIFFFCAI